LSPTLFVHPRGNTNPQVTAAIAGVNVTWSPVAGGSSPIDDYAVSARTPGSQNQVAATVVCGSCTSASLPVATGQAVQVYVSAYNQNPNTGYGQVSRVVTPGPSAAQNLAAAAGSGPGRGTVTFNAAQYSGDGPMDHYYVNAYPTTGPFVAAGTNQTIACPCANQMSATISGLTTSVSYQLYVWDFNTVGGYNYAASNPFTAP
jgi:hypothetical protein